MQVGDLRDALVAAVGRRTANLQVALGVFRRPRPGDWFDERVLARSSDWRVGRPLEGPDSRVPAWSTVGEFIVVATDGSQIEADRHLGLECHLLNTGQVVLRYGAYAAGRLDVTSKILFDDDLYLTNPNRQGDQQKLEGQLLAAKRSILEMAEVYKLAEAEAGGIPVLALQDGTLTLWNLLGSQHRDFVSEILLRDPDEGFLTILDRFRELSARRRVAIATYVSQSTSAEVVNLLRLLICDKPAIQCGTYCGQVRPPDPEQRTCDAVHGVLDRDLFAELLDYGERSAIFEIDVPRLQQEYGDHTTCFFYLNVGSEIARVELPKWLAVRTDDVTLVQQLVLDQVERGLGYPAALIEAHERAVVRAADRDEFTYLIERELQEARLRLPSSEKYVSKRLRAL